MTWLCSVLSFYPWYQQNYFLSVTLFYLMCSQTSAFEGFLAHKWGGVPNILKTRISFYHFELDVSLKGRRKLSWLRCFVLTALLLSRLHFESSDAD